MIIINNKKLNNLNLNDNNFCVVIDFDRTLTSGDSLGSWSVLENTDFVNPNFKKESYLLLDKYYPIELDYTIDTNTKSLYMEEWYHSNMNLFYKYDLTYDALVNCVKYSNLKLRDGAKDFLNKLYTKNIPVVILSAGIGNVIKEFLVLEDCLYSNIYIESNSIKFKNNKMIKYDDFMIHSCNKSMDRLPSNVFNTVNKKDYFLLFGDIIEDLNMVNKKDLSKTISFGFLEANVKDNLEFYKKAFDIVLTDNSSYYDVENILKRTIMSALICIFS